MSDALIAAWAVHPRTPGTFWDITGCDDQATRNKARDYERFGIQQLERRDSVGAAIHEARSRLGLSQEAVARRIGVSQTSVSQWERGLNSPGAIHRIRLLAVLGVDVDALSQGGRAA